MEVWKWHFQEAQIPWNASSISEASFLKQNTKIGAKNILPVQQKEALQNV